MAGGETEAVGPRVPVGCRFSGILHASTSLSPPDWIGKVKDFKSNIVRFKNILSG